MSHNAYIKAVLAVLFILVTLGFSPSSAAAMSAYSQDFEAMTPGQGWPPNDLSDDGWLIYGFAWDADPYSGPVNLVYQYGPYEAANGAPGSIQGVATGEGGPDQGEVVLSKFSDYNNTDQIALFIQAMTYQERTITADDVGIWRFAYDAKIGNLDADSSAFAFIQTLDFTTFAQTAFVSNDSTHLPTEWRSYALDLRINSAMVGDILSFGFSATSTNYNGSAVFYDNLRFARPDFDSDGVHDGADNCILAANADQRDSNEDGFGNICDADFDDNCTVNFVDVGAMKSVFFTDDDDADLNGDGAVNFVDLGLLKQGFFRPPGPSGVPNICDGG